VAPRIELGVVAAPVAVTAATKTLELTHAKLEMKCWNLYGFSPITNCEIPSKSQRPIYVSKGMRELFSTTLLVEVELLILKYGSLLYFLKSSVRRRKRSPYARVLARLASPGGVNGPPKSGEADVLLNIKLIKENVGLPCHNLTMLRRS
jgi:hypothetical protein